MRRIAYTFRASLVAIVTAFAFAGSLPAKADDVETVYPVAIFPFQERGRDVSDLGSKVTDLLFANLVIDPEMFLVDREDLKKTQDEQELNLSGLVNPATAAKVGHLTGAKILITGSVLQVDTTLYVVAKIIGTETSRVLGASVKGGVRDELDGLVEELAQKVSETVSTRASDLVAKPVTREDRLAALKTRLGKGPRPTVVIKITELHVGQRTIDPAAETEMTLFCKELGFDVIDPNVGNRKEADIMIVGEGFSEFASRHGNLVSVKARLEVKAVDRETGRILAIDRHVAVAVDLTEQIAGKTALQDAAANIAERLLPRLVEPAKEDKKKIDK
jgi:TolB-like protein